MRKLSRPIRSVRSLLLVSALSVLAGGVVAQDAASLRETKGQGVIPLDEEAYAKLPKLRRHRAWLPESVDLSDRFPTPGNQEWQGSCVAWATGYAARSFLSADQIGRQPAGPNEVISPEYIYNKVRRSSLSICTSPTFLKDALELLQTEGAVTLAEFPYNVNACQQMPPESLKQSAGKWRIKGWTAIDRETPGDWRTPIILDDLKGQLAKGLPIVFTMQTPRDFKDRDGNAALYRYDGPPVSSFHAMALVGYDDKRQAVRLINSWGPQWGDKGYAWVDYGTFKKLVAEAYVLEPLVAPAAPVSRIGDAVSTTGTADARLAELARGAGCGRLAITTVNGRRTVTGYHGVATDAAILKAKAEQIDPSLDWKVAMRPWPQCEAELTLEAKQGPDPVKLTLANDKGAALAGEPVSMKKGDLFSISVETTAARPYVEVVYLQADGSAVELYRGQPAADAQGRRRAVIGAGGAKETRFQVSAPFGDEVLIAVSSDKPIFEGRLGQTTERYFLTLLRTELAAAEKARVNVSGTVTRVRTVG